MSEDTMPCGCTGHFDNVDHCEYPALEQKYLDLVNDHDTVLHDLAEAVNRTVELEARLAKYQSFIDEYDVRSTKVHAALSEAGIPDWEPYPDEPGISEWEKSLRTGGRMISDDERVRRLTAQRDAKATEQTPDHCPKCLHAKHLHFPNGDCGCGLACDYK